MGAVSTLEDILKRLEDSQFCEHQVADDLRELLLAPVARLPSKRSKGIAHQVQLLLRYLDLVVAENASLTDQIRILEGKLAANKLHVAQLQKRSISEAALKAHVEIRKLRSRIESQDAELTELRSLVMHRLISK